MNGTDSDMDTIEEAAGAEVPADGAHLALTGAGVVPGYYASRGATRSFQPGQYVCVTRVEGHGPTAIVHYQCRDRGYTQDAASFLRAFAYAPEGEAALNRRMLEVTDELARLSQDVAALQQALQHVTVHVGGAGEAAGLEAITAIVPVDDRSPGGFKIALARVRQLAQAKQAELQARQTELQGILAEKLAVANALLAPLQELVGQIEEAIWTVNLYLGKDEEIVRLRDGEPAPASTPISVRQLVLAMDEECAVAAEEGGIDARSIAQFDAWLLERPEHLDQVLPEPKGVVVLVPRRQSKDYGDPWSNRAAQEADRQSYFLIRNGERLYRICTDFIVGTTLLPRRDEFLDFFVEERIDWETRERTRVPLEPGSHAYMEAEKRADARGRHYFRIGLILQGLIDRTPVFHPLPGAIQVTRPEAYDQGWLRIIADAEPALGDGHERFRDWHARLNATLDVGMRVIGAFSGWSGD